MIVLVAYILGTVVAGVGCFFSLFHGVRKGISHSANGAGILSFMHFVGSLFALVALFTYGWFE